MNPSVSPWLPPWLPPHLARKDVLLADPRIAAHDRLAGLRWLGDEVFSGGDDR